MPLPMIYKNGYLTIKDYNHSINTYLSDFQNNEFIPVLANDYLKPRKDVNNWIQDVVDTLDKDDIEQFRKLLYSFLVAPLLHALQRNEWERYFHYTFYLLMYMVSVYTVYMRSSRAKDGGCTSRYPTISSSSS